MFRGKLTGLFSFLGIASLLLGGLGWATRAALRVEEDQRLAAANARASEDLFQAKKERADALKTLGERFPAASIMTTFRELGVTAVETDRDAQRSAELQEMVNTSKFNGRGGNSGYLSNDTKQNFEAGGQGGGRGGGPPGDN